MARRSVATTLSLAVLSSETGVFFTVGFAALLLVLELPRFRSGGIRRLAQAWWYLVPLALSLAVLGCALRFRVGDATSGVAPTNHYFHHLFLSLGATLYVLPKQIAMGEMAMTPRNLLMSSTIDGLFLAGVFCVYRARPQAVSDWRYLLAAAVGLLSVMMLLVLASYCQYGGWGFERHQTFFYCSRVLLLVVLASGAAAALPPWGPLHAFLGRSACLPRWPSVLRHDFRNFSMTTRAFHRFGPHATKPGLPARDQAARCAMYCHRQDR